MGSGARRLRGRGVYGACGAGSPLRRVFARGARVVGRRGSRRRLASARVHGLGAVPARALATHTQRDVLGLVRTVGLGALPLRVLGSRSRLGLDLVPGTAFRRRARVLVLGPELRGLDSLGLLLAPLPELLRERLGLPLRGLRTHRGRLRALSALDLPAARPPRTPATALLLGGRFELRARTEGG